MQRTHTFELIFKGEKSHCAGNSHHLMIFLRIFYFLRSLTLFSHCFGSLVFTGSDQTSTHPFLPGMKSSPGQKQTDNLVSARVQPLKGSVPSGTGENQPRAAV